MPALTKLLFPNLHFLWQKYFSRAIQCKTELSIFPGFAKEKKRCSNIHFNQTYNTLRICSPLTI